MDDKMFEQRMKQLKNSYDSVHTVSSVENIMNEVKKAEQPNKRRHKFQLPYVASFVGVLIIGGLLATQLLTQPDNTSTEKPLEEKINQQPVTETDIETAINEIRGFYERKVDELREHLNFTHVEQYKFVQEAKSAVEAFEERKNYKSQAELTNYMENVREIIELRVSMPNEEMQLLVDKEEVSTDQLLHYMEKLELLNERYIEKWEVLHQENLNEISDITEYVKRLNGEGFNVGSEEYVQLVEELKQNGYTFTNDGEGMISVKIDYDKISSTFSDQLSEELKLYLEIQEGKEIKIDASLTISRSELESRLIQIESIILKSPNFGNINDLKAVYMDWLKTYLIGMDNASIKTDKGTVKQEVISGFEQFVSNNQNTETARVVESFLNDLKASNLILTEELENKVELLIPTELKVVPNGMSIHLLPITDQMIRSYEEFKQTNNHKVFDGPFAGTNTTDLAVARIYMYAVEVGDYDTAYKLLNNGKGSSIPTKEQFITEVSQITPSYQTLSNEVMMVKFQYRQTGEWIQHTYIKENGDTILFNLRLQDGYPRVDYQPSS